MLCLCMWAMREPVLPVFELFYDHCVLHTVHDTHRKRRKKEKRITSAHRRGDASRRALFLPRAAYRNDFIRVIPSPLPLGVRIDIRIATLSHRERH